MPTVNGVNQDSDGSTIITERYKFGTPLTNLTYNKCNAPIFQSLCNVSYNPLYVTLMHAGVAKSQRHSSLTHFMCMPVRIENHGIHTLIRHRLEHQFNAQVSTV